MSSVTSVDLEFKTEAQVNAYADLFLATSIYDVTEEYSTLEEKADFEVRRKRNLQAQLDHFRKIDFSKANVGKNDATFNKVLNASYKVPLSAEGANKQSSRFNYKDAPLFRNQTVYFGKTNCAAKSNYFISITKESKSKKHSIRRQNFWRVS